ncbi:MAG TPA: ribosome biogenesis GTPase Der, partial [Actinomycetota bacterium]|nr:ribosome biogenesis GTPase Der [Actinomycetota bacterium]
MSGRARPPRVVLVGRRNVGKSTLANRLVGRREAIADDEPGVTRDRLELPAEWRGRRFLLVDTGGYVPRARGIEALVAGQADRAAEEADVVLLVVDARAGLREEDALQARRLRRLRAPVLVVANKVDTEREEPDAWAFHALGLGEPVAVSALHGRGAGELLDRLVDLLRPQEAEPEVEGEPRFAIVGRPNVGKSSLFNRLVGEERSVVYEEAGTTRDAVDAVVTWPEGAVRFVDTAGFRRPSRARGVEYYGYVRSLRAIDRADVALLVLDAGEGFTAEDRRIAGRVLEAGRGLVIVANKWDLVRERERRAGELAREVAPFARPRLLRASALLGRGVHRIPPALLETHAARRRRVPTSEVNRVLEGALGERPPPRGVRYRYATQVSAGPPTFVVFGGAAPPPAYRRFLEQRL